jgi:hypothetical protein
MKTILTLTLLSFSLLAFGGCADVPEDDMMIDPPPPPPPAWDGELIGHYNFVWSTPGVAQMISPLTLVEDVNGFDETVYNGFAFGDSCIVGFQPNTFEENWDLTAVCDLGASYTVEEMECNSANIANDFTDPTAGIACTGTVIQYNWADDSILDTFVGQYHLWQ